MSDNNSRPPPKPLASPKPHPPAQTDPWKDRLKEKMAQDRGRLRRGILFVAVTMALIGAAALWWMYPGPPLPPMMTIAFDGIGLQGQEQIEVRLQLEPADPAEPLPPNLAGLKVAFVDLGKSAALTRAVADKFGQARAEMTFAPKGSEIRFQGRFDGNRQVKPSLDLGRIFLVPGTVPLVLVEVQDLLANPEAEISERNLNKMQPFAPAAQLLLKLKAEKKQVIYLALRSDTAQGYSHARRWLGVKGQFFPPGPVLGRPSYHDGDSQEEALRQVVAGLKASWQVSAVGRGQKSADIYRQMGLSYQDIGK